MGNIIDKNMLEFLHQSHNSVVYVNSRDRELTDNTLERFIYEKEREDIYGDCYYDNKFTADYPDYEIEVKLCAFTSREMASAQNVFNKFIK